VFAGIFGGGGHEVVEEKKSNVDKSGKGSKPLSVKSKPQSKQQSHLQQEDELTYAAVGPTPRSQKGKK
jgi:hypothetical protein